MKANKKTLLAVKYFLENEQEYWDKEEMISDVVAETKLLKHKDMGEQTLSPDECGIEWDGTEICNLQDFIDEYTRQFIQGICNVLDSFIAEDIDCYFEDEDC